MATKKTTAGTRSKTTRSAAAKTTLTLEALGLAVPLATRLIEAVGRITRKGGALPGAEASAVRGAQRILYIHGIGNKPLASVLKCQWDTALFGFDLGERSRLAYWVNRARYPHPESATCGSADLTEGDEEASTPGIQALDADDAAWLDREVASLTDDRQEASLLQKLAAQMRQADTAEAETPPRGMGARALPLPRFARRWITRRLTKTFLKDVHDLFYVPERRELMLQSVYERLRAGGGPFVVVGHSQGSMIAYLALSLLPEADVEVPLLVTIGSPLGLTEVRDELKKILGTQTLVSPRIVKKWINVADRLDPVALDAKLATDYSGVTDFRVDNPDSPRHPHSGSGYLRTDPVQKAVRDVIDLAAFQPVGNFVIARDVARALENSGAEDRHEVLIELAKLREGQQAMADVRAEVVSAIKRIRAESGKDGTAHDDDYEVEELERFVSARLTRTETEVLASSLGSGAAQALKRIWKNARKQALMETSIGTLQVRPAHNAYRSMGSDIHWAVLDSGIQDQHPHFLDASGAPRTVVATYDCTRTGPLKAGPAADVHGHGTHVAGIIAGQYAHGGRNLVAMAPEARLHVYKVLDDAGRGKDSWIIKALDHIARTNEQAGGLVIHGVNLSLGGPFDPGAYACGHSPLCRELRRLWRQGVVVVIAAGNEGYTLLQAEDGEIQANLALSIGDPANLEEAIAVGSIHKESPHIYGGSYFSSRGPTADGRQKPDVVAPGERILSCRHRLLGTRQRVEDLYVEMSGTSMAAPHVSGLIAAFLSTHREFAGYPDKVKEKLLAACTDLNRERAQQGAGMPNLVKMLVSS